MGLSALSLSSAKHKLVYSELLGEARKKGTFKVFGTTVFLPLSVSFFAVVPRIKRTASLINAELKCSGAA